VFCVTSAKHGSGATTLAVNLAGIIAARSKQSTALLDLDRPVGDSAAYLNLKPAFTVSDALNAGPRLDSVLLESYMQMRTGVRLMAGSRKYAPIRRCLLNGSASCWKSARILSLIPLSICHQRSQKIRCR